MLVLTRKLGEAIVIGEDIKFRVLGIRGTQIKIGVEAPEGVSVYREELYEKIKRENISASELKIDINKLEEIFLGSNK